MSIADSIEGALYHLAISSYSKGVAVASLGKQKARFLYRGQHDAWGKLAAIRPDDRVAWFHAASLGEFEQARPLIERLRAMRPEMKVLLTFFSPSGYEIRKNYDRADWVCYLPFDTPDNARRFVGMAHPEVAVFVKYEIWRNYLTSLHEAGIPTYLVAAAFRENQAFFRPVGARYRKWLHLFSRIFVQDENSRRLLDGIGIGDAIVAGDTRFDRVTDIMAARKEIPDIERFAEAHRSQGRIMMVAGSSWPPDEDAYIPWLLERKQTAAIIAPHEFDADRLKKLVARFGTEATLYSDLQKDPALAEGKRILIIDCFGLLSSIYRFADFAHIGGGFGVGIHNINEAAVYGIPVTFGPNYHRFIEAEELEACGGAVPLRDADAFPAVADRLLDADERQKRGKAAGDYIRSRLGASDKIADMLFSEPDFKLK